MRTNYKVSLKIDSGDLELMCRNNIGNIWMAAEYGWIYIITNMVCLVVYVYKFHDENLETLTTQ